VQLKGLKVLFTNYIFVIHRLSAFLNLYSLECTFTEVSLIFPSVRHAMPRTFLTNDIPRKTCCRAVRGCSVAF
jgi:hypothetical protein